MVTRLLLLIFLTAARIPDHERTDQQAAEIPRRPVHAPEA